MIRRVDIRSTSRVEIICWGRNGTDNIRGCILVCTTIIITIIVIITSRKKGKVIVVC